MFYTNFLKLCNSVGKTPSAVAIEMGIKKSTVTRWKQGKSQTDANIQRVADYFGVPVSDLTAEPKEKPIGSDADGLSQEERDYLDWFRGASDMEKEMVRRIMKGG